VPTRCRLRSIEKLGLDCGQVFELGDFQLVPQVFAFADLLSTGVATSCAILTREFLPCGVVLEQARPFNACPPAVPSED
jgi:hypothetical protein